MRKDATFSPDGRYRYTLTRIEEEGKKIMLFIMLNPSKADANIDDQTITKCEGFAKANGYGGIYVVNLFPYISTDPKKLLDENINVLGENNLEIIKEAITKSDIIVCAWGNEEVLKKKNLKFLYEKTLNEISNEELYCLQLTKAGTPCHPSRLSYKLKPKRYYINMSSSR